MSIRDAVGPTAPYVDGHADPLHSSSGVGPAPSGGAASLLVLEAVSRRYQVRLPGGLFGRRASLHAVDEVSLALDAGRTLAIVGESGCGKSTTARLALGLIEPSAGTVHFEGEALPPRGSKGWRALRRRMQLVYQDPLAALDRRLGALEQVVEPLTIFRVGSHAQRIERASALLAEVGLAPALQQRFPHELSGGQRQRVVLARALALSPSLLVCDEPISALDVSIQAQVINLLAELQVRHRLAMLFISHDLKVVRQIADEVAVMYLGRVVEQASAAQLFAAPAHPYTQALVSAIPSMRAAQRRRRILLEGDPPNPIDVPSGCAFHPRCPIAVERCRHERPVLQPVAAGHRTACHRIGVPVPT